MTRLLAAALALAITARRPQAHAAEIDSSAAVFRDHATARLRRPRWRGVPMREQARLRRPEGAVATASRAAGKSATACDHYLTDGRRCDHSRSDSISRISSSASPSFVEAYSIEKLVSSPPNPFAPRNTFVRSSGIRADGISHVVK